MKEEVQMSTDFQATLSESSPRYADWLQVFGSNQVALKSPVPVLASAPGVEKGLFYMVDLDSLSAEQKSRLIKFVAHKFNLSESEVESDLYSVGCPLRDDDIIITVFNPLKWV